MLKKLLRNGWIAKEEVDLTSIDALNELVVLQENLRKYLGIKLRLGDHFWLQDLLSSQSYSFRETRILQYLREQEKKQLVSGALHSDLYTLGEKRPKEIIEKFIQLGFLTESFEITPVTKQLYEVEVSWFLFFEDLLTEWEVTGKITEEQKEQMLDVLENIDLDEEPLDQSFVETFRALTKGQLIPRTKEDFKRLERIKNHKSKFEKGLEWLDFKLRVEESEAYIQPLSENGEIQFSPLELKLLLLLARRNEAAKSSLNEELDLNFEFDEILNELREQELVSEEQDAAIFELLNKEKISGKKQGKLKPYRDAIKRFCELKIIRKLERDEILFSNSEEEDEDFESYHVLRNIDRYLTPNVLQELAENLTNLEK